MRNNLQLNAYFKKKSVLDFFFFFRKKTMPMIYIKINQGRAKRKKQCPVEHAPRKQIKEKCSRLKDYYLLLNPLSQMLKLQVLKPLKSSKM